MPFPKAKMTLHQTNATTRLMPRFDSGHLAPSPAAHHHHHHHLLPASPSTALCEGYRSPSKHERILFYIHPSPRRCQRTVFDNMSGVGANIGESVPKPRSPLVRPKPLTPARATPPKTASPGGPGSAGKKEASVAGGQQAGSLEEHEPVDPSVLANAIGKLDTLRKVKTPSASTAPSAATSPAASGASSPNPGGLPTHGLSQTVMLQGAGQPAGGVPVTLQMAPASQPATPAVTGQTPGQQQAMDVKISAASAPGTPHFGAQSEM